MVNNTEFERGLYFSHIIFVKRTAPLFMMLVEGICLLVVVVVYFIIDELIMKRHLPPGPIPLPIIGNLHLLSSRPYRDLYQLAFRYGPVYRLQIGRNLNIVINSYHYAREALVKNGAAFSGRPSVLAGKLFSRDGKGVGFQGYTKQLKKQRKAIIHTMRTFEKDGRMEELVEGRIHELLANINKRFNNGCKSTMPSVDLRNIVTVANNHIMASFTFGKNLKKEDKDEISQIAGYLGVFSDSLVVTSIIDAFPFMKYFPFKIINKLREAIRVRDRIFDKRFKIHKKLFDKNYSQVNDLVDLLIQMQEKSDGVHSSGEILTDDHAIMAINDVVIAGTEGPSSNLIFIIYFLVKFPGMQMRIQNELDDVIGRFCMPRCSDRGRLPYLEAFVYECMRCGSLMPLALPHQTTADTNIGSYHIPKNTTVLVNLYAINHDLEIWQNPMVFDPERFLNKNGTLNTVLASKVITFGIGPRTCPGEILARMELFLFTASLLQKYTFTYNGSQLPGEEKTKFGLVLRSPDIDVTISKRQ